MYLLRIIWDFSVFSIWYRALFHFIWRILLIFLSQSQVYLNPLYESNFPDVGSWLIIRWWTLFFNIMLCISSSWIDRSPFSSDGWVWCVYGKDSFSFIYKNIGLFSFSAYGHAKFDNFTWPDMQKMSCVGSLSLFYFILYVYISTWWVLDQWPHPPPF